MRGTVTGSCRKESWRRRITAGQFCALIQAFVTGIHVVLGADRLLARDSGQTLIEAGPYRYVRHPSYSGALLSLLGFGLALGNWAGLTAALSCLGFAYFYRIPIEDRALSSAFGDVYRQYMNRTWRLVPFLF